MSYFEDKSHQLSISGMVAFGIEIESRYSKANEIIDMIKFCMDAAKDKIESSVKSVCYDSKASIVAIKMNDQELNIDKVNDVAKKYFHHYFIDDTEFENYGII